MTERADRKFRRLATVVTALVVPVGVAAGALTAVAAPGIALSGLAGGRGPGGSLCGGKGDAVPGERSASTTARSTGATGAASSRSTPTNAELIKPPATSYPVYGVFKAASN